MGYAVESRMVNITGAFFFDSTARLKMDGLGVKTSWAVKRT